MVRNWGGGGHQDFPQSIAVDSIKGLGQSTKAAYRPMSTLLLELPQHENRVCSPSVGPEPTLALWHAFLSYHQGKPFQKGMSQDFACNGKVMPW